MSIMLPNGSKKVEMPYTFTLDPNFKITEDPDGGISFMGTGVFKGYGGESSIRIRKKENGYNTTVYQKTYVREGEPEWNDGPFKTVKGYTYVNKEG